MVLCHRTSRENDMTTYVGGHVSGVYFYPIKSCGAVLAETLDIHTDLGVYGDRVVALVHPDTGKVLTQREFPQLATVRVDPSLIETRKTLFLTAMINGQPYAVEMPLFPIQDKKLACTVHKDAATGYDIRSSEFFEKLLGFKPQCVLLDEHTPRVHHSSLLGRNVTLGYADSHPLLVTTTASLAALNATLRDAGHTLVPMSRFRPNIVVQSVVPWEEDSWKLIRIGPVVLEYAKPCGRCVMTTIDQKTGIAASAEPLRTLTKMRPAKGGPLFGAYYVVRERGLVSFDNPVEVLETRVLQ